MLDLIVKISQISPLVSGILTIALGVYVWIKGLKKPPNTVFFVFCFLLCCWALGCYVQSNTHSVPLAYEVDQLLYSVAVFFPFSLVALVNTFTKKKFHRIYAVTLGMGLALLASNWLGYFRTGVNLNFGSRYVTTPDWGWYVFLSFFTLVSNIMLWELFKKIKISSDEAKKKFKLLLASLVVLIVAGGCYFTLILIKIGPLVDSLLNLNSSILLGVFTLMMSYIITKHDLMEFKTIITKSVAYIITSVLFAIVYLSLVWLYFYQFETAQITPQFLMLTILFGAWAVGLYFHRVQRFIQTSAYRKFLKINYDFESVLKHASKQLAKAIKQSDVLDQLLELQNSLEVGSSLAMIRKGENFECFELALSDQPGQPAQNRHLGEFKGASKLMTIFAIAPNPVMFFADLPKKLQEKLSKTYTISPQSVCLIVKPLNQVQAVFIIGPKLSEDPYNSQELSLFEVIVNQAVLVFERIEKLNQLAESASQMEALNKELEGLNQQLEQRVVEEVSVRNRAVSAAQNLALKASMSNLTAGISHEIRNPMTSIKSNAQNLYAKLVGDIGEDPNPWQSALTSRHFIDITLGNVELANGLFDYAQEKGFISPEGEITHLANPFYESLSLPDLPDFLAPYASAVAFRLGELFKSKQVLTNLSLISRESERVIAITNTMLEFGVSKGLGQDSFTKLQGFTPEKSARLWQELIDKKYLDVFGGILMDLTQKERPVNLELSAEFQPNHGAIVQLLQTIPTAQKTLFDPAVPLKQLLELKQTDLSKQGIQLRVEFAHTAKIKGDANRIFQVFNILISNAIESMEKVSGEKKLEISIQDEKDGILCQIEDSGCGMSKDTLAHIRDPFFTTKGGTGGKNVGLGISILYDIVESHGGTVDIESALDQGTIFRVFFSDHVNKMG